MHSRRKASPSETRTVASARPGVAPTLLVAGLALTTLAWVFGNPPGAAPDEPSHFVKAVAAGRGDLTGSGVAGYPEDAFTPEQRRQIDRSHRSFSIPPTVRYQSTLTCTAFRPDVTAQCIDDDHPALAGDPSPSIVGAYQPFLYVPPGLLARASDHREDALRWARVGSATLSVALLAMAVWLLWDGDRRGRQSRLLGLVVAVTPMVLFISSQVGASGPEITGGLAFAAGVLRLSRPDAPPGPLAWVLVGVAGLLLALSRPLAPLWVALLALLPMAVLGVGGAWRRQITGGRYAAVAVALPVLGVVANVVWAKALGLGTPMQWGRFPELAGRVPRHVVRVTKEAIGVFGWQDTFLPRTAYVVWLALLVALVAGALVLGRRRDRVVLLGALAGSVVVAVAVTVLFEQNALGVLGRYLLPVAVAVPLLAGEAVGRGRVVRPIRPVLVVMAGTAASVHVLSWLVNARRYAVGFDGPMWFVPRAAWAPPGGWWPWVAVIVVAGAAQVAAAIWVHRASD